MPVVSERINFMGRESNIINIKEIRPRLIIIGEDSLRDAESSVCPFY